MTARQVSFFLLFALAGFVAGPAAAQEAGFDDTELKIRQGVKVFQPQTYCDWAKKDAAGTLNWARIEASDVKFNDARWRYAFWKQENTGEYNECFEIGRRYGDASYEEILDRRAKEMLSGEAYKEWKQSKTIAGLEEEVKKGKAQAAARRRRLAVPMSSTQ